VGGRRVFKRQDAKFAKRFFGRLSVSNIPEYRQESRSNGPAVTHGDG
jgi:hypothetical protein